MKVEDTLNLGKTKFPMRGNLPNKEAEWQKAWEENKIYEKRQKLNEGKPTFELLDGPPFANGDIHMGHALNKISKDIIVRYKSMNGFRSPYVPGWDRSEEHTSELQSRFDLVCRLLLEKKK